MPRRTDVERRLHAEWETLVAREAEAAGSGPLSLPPQARLPLRRPALFAELEDLRASFRELAPEIARHAEHFVNPGWNLRQLVAHLASWAREFRFEVETVARGEAFDYAIPYALSVFGPTQWNEEQVAVRAERSVEDLLQELDAETARLQDLVIEIPEERFYAPAELPHAPGGDAAARWHGSCAMVIYGKCQHDRHHLQQIGERLAAWR